MQLKLVLERHVPTPYPTAKGKLIKKKKKTQNIKRKKVKLFSLSQGERPDTSLPGLLLTSHEATHVLWNPAENLVWLLLDLCLEISSLLWIPSSPQPMDLTLSRLNDWYIMGWRNWIPIAKMSLGQWSNTHYRVCYTSTPCTHPSFWGWALRFLNGLS